jgi:molybdenum-dependent DNA-binding transcriptional regulator ModE
MTLTELAQKYLNALRSVESEFSTSFRESDNKLRAEAEAVNELLRAYSQPEVEPALFNPWASDD